MRALTILGLIALLSACSPKEAAEPSAAADTAAPATVIAEAAPAPPMVMLPVEGLVEPARGDPLRKALLDELRPTISKDLGVPVEFAVRTLRVSGDWAFAVMEPVKPSGGGPIAFSETRLKDEEGEWDGLRTEAFWRLKEGRWQVTQHAIGATDVWYEPHCDAAPKGLIPICANRTKKP